MRVFTWYLDAAFYRLHDVLRPVVLGDDFAAWEQLLKQSWSDILDPSVDTDFAIVTPSPDQYFSIHIILHQRLWPHVRANLITVYDNGYPASSPRTFALILPGALRRTELIREARCHIICPPLYPFSACSTWQEGWELDDTHLFRCAHGHAFMVIVHRFSPPDLPDTLQTASSSAASSSLRLLQTRVSLLKRLPSFARRLTVGQVAHTQRPCSGTSKRLNLSSLIPAPVMSRIDFRPVQDLCQQLLQVPLGPVHSRASIVKWHDSTLCALGHTPDWNWSTPIGFSFFTDGTSAYLENRRSAACAVVLIVHTTEGDQFGGFRTFNVGVEHYAPRAEMTAICIALLWAAQLLDTAPCKPAITFCFDCTAAGFTASGDWGFHSHTVLQTGIRSLVHWIETRYVIQCSWWHVQAHNAHPWNEAADASAWSSISGWIDSEDFSPLWDHIIASPLLPWLWMLEAAHHGDPAIPSIVHGDMLINITKTFASAPVSDHHPVRQRQSMRSPPSQFAEILMRCATANVLTLHPNKAEHGQGISARCEALLKACESEGILIVGVQETRSRNTGHQSLEGYHILSAPATSRGIGGCQIWIKMIWPTSNGTLHIPHTALRILHASTQRLLVQPEISASLWTCSFW